MLSKIQSCAIHGVNGYIVDVEVDLGNGIPAFDLVGLPDSAVKESRERVRTAIKNSNIPFPIKRITVNLAPANTRKEGPSFDLPIAAGILSCMGIIPSTALANSLVTGELSLDGSVRSVSGILPMIYTAQQSGISKCFIPYENADEGAIVNGIDVFPVKSLQDLINHLCGNEKIKPHITDIETLFAQNPNENILDFADVKGQEGVKRAMEVSAAGKHCLLLSGHPGTGKTMLAKRLPTILPDLTFMESIEITKIHSVAGLLTDKTSLITRRPFRSPHHTVSPSALTGGGRIPKPGEISLAHNGVLFLDELPEFTRGALEVMRQPLEDGQVTISRVNSTLTYPSNFMLVAAMNPCPCGYLGDDRCHCTANEIIKYRSKISGPLLDRIDIFSETPDVNYSDLEDTKPQETSAEIKIRVEKAHKIQLERYENENIFFNSQLSAAQIEKYCVLGENEKNLLKSAFDSLRLSARAYHKILKVARTIADLDGSSDITLMHLAEAIQYRGFDREYILQ